MIVVGFAAPPSLVGCASRHGTHDAERPPVSSPPAIQAPDSSHKTTVEPTAPAQTPPAATPQATPSQTTPSTSPSTVVSPTAKPPTAVPRTTPEVPKPSANAPAASGARKATPPAVNPPTKAPPTPATSAPALDLNSLEQRLKDTRAIGLFTKLSLKNQVDDLLNEFRAFHQGSAKTPQPELRQKYDLLMIKVLSLLQDGDPQLATAVASSREAIWGILMDPQKFSKI
jgi:hypothetical protein